MNNKRDYSDIKERTKSFTINIIKFCGKLIRNQASYVISKQILRSGSSVGANYRAACRARSKADFISKLGIVLEEADETLYWLELINELNLGPQTLLVPLLKESNELVSIFVSSINTAKSTS